MLPFTIVSRYSFEDSNGDNKRDQYISCNRSEHKKVPGEGVNEEKRVR